VAGQGAALTCSHTPRHQQTYIPTVLWIRDPGSGAFLTPGPGDPG